MTEYTWELGIDWNAVETGTAGVSYLRGGLLANGVPSPGTAPAKIDDTITFRIFDVSSSVSAQQVTGINRLDILTKAAVKVQSADNPLDNRHPAIVSSIPSEQSSLFGNAYCSWTSATVRVNTEGRFLLTMQVRADGPDNADRLFSHDPEMVVGPHGG